MAIHFNAENAGIYLDKHNKEQKLLKSEISNMLLSLKYCYKSDYASVCLPSDLSHLNESQKIAKKIGKVDLLILVGIGGSNLGTLAVHEAINGKNYNELRKGTRFFNVDTLDVFSIQDCISLMKDYLKRKNKVLLVCSSKSGRTSETIANTEILFSEFKKLNKNSSRYTVLITDKYSGLWKLGLKEGFHLLEIPKMVEGRYSVFSSVGLFPLFFLGIDLKKLLSGAKDMRNVCLSTNILKNPAAHSALVLYSLWKKNYHIHNTFFFSPKLESLGKCYRQLMAESIGKEWNAKHKKRVYIGITPTVSIGSTDLHSMAQLYLGGPKKEAVHTIVTAGKVPMLKVPSGKFSALVDGIKEKSTSFIMESISKGFENALKKQNRPFMHIEIEEISEYNIGAFLQMKMIEIILLARLMGVNPFDQPNVDDYKNETRKFLQRKSEERNKK